MASTFIKAGLATMILASAGGTAIYTLSRSLSSGRVSEKIEAKDKIVSPVNEEKKIKEVKQEEEIKEEIKVQHEEKQLIKQEKEDLHKENKLEEVNNPSNKEEKEVEIPKPLSLPLQQRVEERIKKDNFPELDKKELEKEKVWLEAAWIISSPGIPETRCRLIWKEDKDKETKIPNIIDDSDDDGIDYCKDTYWLREKSKRRNFRTNGRGRGSKEVLSIRGDSDAVRKTVEASWTDIVNSNFTKYKTKYIPKGINELNQQFCKVVNNENWTELTCQTK